MSHIRQQIRDRVKVLLSGNTSAGTNVKSGQVYPDDQGDLPSIRVTSPSSVNADDEAGTMSALGVVVSIVLELRARSRDNIEDALDDLSAEIAPLLGAATNLGIGVYRTRWQSHELELTADQEQPTGVLREQWDVLCKVSRSDHETLI